ncbi:MAG: sulfotransferase domain-containing protein [Burkholderiales bacterium]|nr:sulfotransferase domain-containing protein [Burkholderiales bacterium]
MNTAAVNSKKKELLRGYQLITEYLSIKKGYKPNHTLISKIKYIVKLLEYQFLFHYFGSPPKWRIFLRKFSGKRTLPDFCIIGEMKSGTSDLSVNLLLHPNIMAPLAKEFRSADPEDWYIYYPTERQKERHAKRYGLALSPYLVPGLDWMERTYNFSQIQPNTKVILVLRDPVKRLYTHWKWEVFISGKKCADKFPFLRTFTAYVDQALALFPEGRMYTAVNSDPLRLGIYWKVVSYWMECFGRSNILILDVADYFADRNKFLGQIHRFVGLPDFEYPISNYKVNENPLVLPPPDDNSIQKLVDFYRPHNEKLWMLINKKFDWC